MSYAALLSGITLANANLGAVHGFASSVGAMFNIPHGVVCGSLMGVTNRISVTKLRKAVNGKTALNKYAVLGRIFSEAEQKAEDWYIDFFLNYIDELTELLAIPKLSKYGIHGTDLDKIASTTDSKSNPVKLNKEDYLEILESRL